MKHVIMMELTEVEEELVETQIEMGLRPKHWDNVTHSDYHVWQELLRIAPDNGLLKRI